MTDEPRPLSGVARINALDRDPAIAEFLRCCGSSRWALAMADARPFADHTELHAQADAIWEGLDPDDWREAFSHHPRIGAGDADRSRFAETRDWSRGEQAGVTGAAADVRSSLAALNDRYFDRFGHVFLICASGKSAEEMLKALRDRIDNDPGRELRVAAEEQRRITELRLDKLLES